MVQLSECLHRNRQAPEARSHRVAEFVRGYIAQSGCTSTEVAFRIGADKRDLERLLRDETCGPRLEDRLAAYFGWPFVEAVFAPVIETKLEAEIARERIEIAAREERLARLYRARQKSHPQDREAVAEDRSWAPSAGRQARTAGAGS